MGHSITLNLPEKAWQDLQRAGRDRNEPPEAVAEQLLAEAVADPLISLFGSMEFGKTDVGECHDMYLGVGIQSEQGRG